MSTGSVNRRSFLRAAATGAALTLPAKSYASVAGSLEKLRIGFLGCGGRAQAHFHVIKNRSVPSNPVETVAVCDVWDGLTDEYVQTHNGQSVKRRYSQGLYPAAQFFGLDTADKNAVTKDYRRVLDRSDIDLVCISTPDHWHGLMTLDALAAGKDVYVERPMTRTSEEAIAVLDASAKYNRVLTVGVQSLADSAWRVGKEWITAGRIGPVHHISAGVFREDSRGMWRFYRTVKQMNTQTIDWDLFLGHRFKVNGQPIGPSPQECPFDSKVYAQWRCYSPFSGGPFTDFFAQQLTRLLATTGLKFPSKVTAAGGTYQEVDGRTVPDVGTMIVDFAEGCQLVLSGSTLSAHGQDELIRGRLGMLRLSKGSVQLLPHAGQAVAEVRAVELPKNDTEALWSNFLDCVRRRDRNTLSPPELGAATSVMMWMAQEACADGRARIWDAEQRVSSIA
jgi:predicted dehydrogenase